jgi:ubiquinol-cytochrome c reductase cytochrome c1 subunit
MRRMLPALGAVALTASLIGGPSGVASAESLPTRSWSFAGPFGGLDLAAAQRGFQVYKDVCANCHSMNLLHYRDLAGIGLNQDQIKAIAAQFTVPQGIDDSGQPKEGPALPQDTFKAPFANDQAARAALNGALPPDLSVIIKAREGGANYIFDLLTGYSEPPEGFNLAQGLYYNKWFPGHQIAMPPPLTDDAVTYSDGTKATLDQESHDVATFLYWAANPEMVARKRLGIQVVLFLIFMTGLTYAVKRKVWSDLH